MAFPISANNCLLLIYRDFTLTSSIVLLFTTKPYQKVLSKISSFICPILSLFSENILAQVCHFFFFFTCTITVLHCLILNIHHALARVIHSILYCIVSLLFGISSVAHLYAENEIQTLCAANKSLHSWVPAHLPLLAGHRQCSVHCDILLLADSRSSSALRPLLLLLPVLTLLLPGVLPLVAQSPL